MGNDAAAFHPESCRRRRRRLVHVAVGVALEDRPVARHAKVDVHADILVVSFAEPRKQILADGLDRAEGLVVDGRGAFRETTIRRRARELLADEFLAVARRHAVDGVAFDHSYRCPEWCRAPGSGSDREQREDVGHGFDARKVLRARLRTAQRRCSVLVDCSRDDESTMDQLCAGNRRRQINPPPVIWRELEV